MILNHRNLASIIILSYITFLAASVSANTFTGAVDNNWNEPRNWTKGKCPDIHDDVVIPEGKSVIITFDSEFEQIPTNSLENNGTIKIYSYASSDKNPTISIWGNSIKNSGTIDGVDAALIISSSNENLANSGTIQSTSDIKISSFEKINNDVTGLITGGSIKIKGEKGIDNKGQIISGDATDSQSAGDITLIAQEFTGQSHDINNRGIIRIGNGNSTSRGGKARITAKNVNCYPGSYLFGGMGAVFGGIIEFFIEGKIVMAGESATGTGIPATYRSLDKSSSVNLNQYTYYKIVGDTVVFNGENSNTYGEYVLVRANVIIFEGDKTSDLLMADKGITLETPPGGTIDFSRLTHENVISTFSDSIHLYSDNIIPPAGGLESISEQPIVQHISNDQAIEASLFYLGQTCSTEIEVDTVLFKIQNTGTTTESFNYNISSQLGSVTSQGKTANLNPFESTVLELALTRPESMTTDTTDTLTLIVAEKNGFSDTLTASVFIAKELNNDVSDKTLTPDNFSMIRAYPNPFNPSTTITFTLSQMQEITFKVVNARGEVISRKHLRKLNSGEHSIQWDGSKYASGNYYMIVETETAKRVIKTLLIK